MPRTVKQRLTDIAVKRMAKPGHYSAGEAPGLLLQVTQSGAKSWIVRLTAGTRINQAGKTVQRRIDFGLGAYPEVSLKDARTKALEYRTKVIEKGEDPRAEKQAARSLAIAKRDSAMTFRKASAALIESMRAGWKNAKHAEQWTNTLETYAGPVMGEMLVGDIDLPHVIAVLKPIWETKTETASRVRSRVEAVLGWSRVHGYRTGDNPARWKDNLDKVFPSAKSVTPVEHVAALPVADVPVFMRDLRARDGVRARALEFTVLTGLRVGRVVAARWSEFDKDLTTWTIPAELMKGRKGKGREHKVPLSKSAVRILRAQADAHPDWVFPGLKDGKHITDAALSGLLGDMNYKDAKGSVVDTHGFRSTFRDWASEHTDYPREVAEMALAHSIGDKVEAAYRRGDLFEKRRALMTDWDKFCTAKRTR